MPLVYFEPEDLKKLSDFELVKKQTKIQDMLADYYAHPISNKEIVKQLYILDEAYTAELDRRYDEGLIDDDKLEELFEDEDFA